MLSRSRVPSRLVERVSALKWRCRCGRSVVLPNRSSSFAPALSFNPPFSGPLVLYDLKDQKCVLRVLGRKLARLRAQLLEPAPGAGSGGGAGFDVSKSGDARIALVGFPSVGKSTFLSKITKTKSEVAAYSFTTLTAIPGVLEYGGAEIQILDLPGIIEGASEGKGRGRQVISAAKVCLWGKYQLTAIVLNDVSRRSSDLHHVRPPT